MSNNIRNIKTSVRNIFNAATGTVAATTQLAADLSTVVASAVSATPEVAKELLKSPVSAYQGYIMEADDLGEEEAKAIAERYITQDVAITTAQAARAAGKLAAALFADDEDDDNNANTTTTAKERNANA